jgi:hypothetical protein
MHSQGLRAQSKRGEVLHGDDKVFNLTGLRMIGGAAIAGGGKKSLPLPGPFILGGGGRNDGGGASRVELLLLSERSLLARVVRT